MADARAPDFRIREYEFPEYRLPYSALIGGQIADREQRVQQCTVRSAVVGGGVPPVVHQHVEWRQRFDVMPPPVGNEQRVAGSSSACCAWRKASA